MERFVLSLFVAPGSDAVYNDSGAAPCQSGLAVLGTERLVTRMYLGHLDGIQGLTNVSGLESYPDLKAPTLQDFKCHMVLGTATSASAGGKSTGSLMAHM